MRAGSEALTVVKHGCLMCVDYLLLLETCGLNSLVVATFQSIQRRTANHVVGQSVAVLDFDIDADFDFDLDFGVEVVFEFDLDLDVVSCVGSYSDVYTCVRVRFVFHGCCCFMLVN